MQSEHWVFQFLPQLLCNMLLFQAITTSGFVEQPPFGIMPSVFDLAPGQEILMEVGD